MEGYGVVPKCCQLLQTYWRRLPKGERAGGYYRAAFKGAHILTHGDPLYPTIFNVVVDAVVRH